MSYSVEYGVMHRDGRVIPPDGTYPFGSRRMAEALARDLDDDCGDDCGAEHSGRHQIVRRTISDWHTLQPS